MGVSEMAQTLSFDARLPVLARPEVAVVGGGIAGTCAAVAAARQGAEVLLIERYNALGGTATISGVGSFCGETRGQGEVFDEIVARLDRLGVIADYAPYEESESRTFDHEWLKYVLQGLVEDAGVRVLLHSTVVAAQRESARVPALVVACKGSLGAVTPRVIIDASGDADVVAAAGFEFERGSAGMQLPMSQMTFVRDVGERVERPLPEGLEPYADDDELPMTSIWREPRGKAGIKIKVPGYDVTDPWSLTAAEMEARRRSLRVIEHLRRGELATWVLDHSTGQIGVREGRRAVGEYVLTEQDVRAGRRFDDGVAVGRFYLDFHDPTNDARTYAVEPVQVPPYHIPWRSLVPRGARNLLVAGRCLSCDQVALSSARVMTTCAMMGQAAGMAAAWAADEDTAVADTDVARLRASLVEHGAALDLDD